MKCGKNDEGKKLWQTIKMHFDYSSWAWSGMCIAIHVSCFYQSKQCNYIVLNRLNTLHMPVCSRYKIHNTQQAQAIDWYQPKYAHCANCKSIGQTENCARTRVSKVIQRYFASFWFFFLVASCFAFIHMGLHAHFCHDQNFFPHPKMSGVAFC